MAWAMVGPGNHVADIDRKLQDSLLLGLRIWTGMKQTVPRCMTHTHHMPITQIRTANGAGTFQIMVADIMLLVSQATLQVIRYKFPYLKE